MKEENSIEKSELIPELDIVFGLDRDIERLKTTLEKLEWYKEQGYSESNIKIPAELSNTSSDESILDIVSAEFSEEKYKIFYEYVEAEWATVSSDLERLKQIRGFKLRDKYTLILTKYGSGGSYNSDRGEIVINIDLRSKEKIMGTIIHEIVHIGIQHLINAHNIKHWHKEKLVDLLVDKLFPGLKGMQRINEDTTTVDKAFNNFFPDLEAIIQAM